MIILASQSPRRQELLRQIGCKFRVEVSHVDEVSADASPELVAADNATRKALDVAQRTGFELPVLGADTVVDVDGEILGKPRNRAEAVAMLAKLRGREHTVWTGIALATRTATLVDLVRTGVEFAAMSDEQIAEYVATGEPFDKAGAYGIQGRAARHIIRIDGSYSNVVGLPLHAVCALADKAGANLFE